MYMAIHELSSTTPENLKNSEEKCEHNHLSFLYIVSGNISMGFFPYSTHNHQLKISPIVFLEQITKYLSCQ